MSRHGSYNSYFRSSAVPALLGVFLAFVMLLSGCSKDDKKGAEKAPDGAQAVEAPTDPANEHFQKGIRLSLTGRYDESIEEFNQSLKLNPDNAPTHNNIGFAYMNVGDLDNALKHQKKALEVMPDFANAHYGMAMVLERQGDTKGAVESWKRFMELSEPQSKWWLKARERVAELEKTL